MSDATENRFEIKNLSGLSDEVVARSPQMSIIQRQIGTWLENMHSYQAAGSMFDRLAYTPPQNPYDEMRAARTAVQTDDIVSGVAEVSEAYGWQGCKFESTEADEADIFNQWAADVNLDDFLRTIGREEFTYSQFIVAMQWDWCTYTPRNKAVDTVEPDTGNEVVAVNPDGTPAAAPAAPKKQKRARRKSYKLWMPVKFIVLDPLKVVPVEPSPINDPTLCWSATNAEIGWWRSVQNGTVVDTVAQQFYQGIYQPSQAERSRLAQLHVPNPDNLIVLNPDNVWRHTVTKPDYEVYPTIRLKSLFQMLDMRRQLIAADRAALIGAANYIVLVTKGEPQNPGLPEEIDALKQNFNFIAKQPVIISDHRLHIEIITPKTDLTLNLDRYQTIDMRLLMRLLGTLSLGGRGQRNETNITLSASVARMMENRRHMIRRTIEKKVLAAILEHPNNQGTDGKGILKEEPNLVFTPRSIQLGFDPMLVQAMLSLRTQREISRETILEQFGLDEATEAMRLELEKQEYDDIFNTWVPFAGQAPGLGDTGDPASNGRQGGRPLGTGNDDIEGTP